MFLPESMSRIMVVGTKARMDDAINAFYSEKVIHVIDHTTGDDGLSIGTSNTGVSKASERLLKIRTLEKELGIKKRTLTEDIAVEDVRERIEAGDVETVEKEILSVVDKRNGLTQLISELNAKKETLGLLSKLPLTLDFYSGYRSISVLVGTTTADPAALNLDAEIFAYFHGKIRQGVVAVFFRNDSRDKVSAALSEIGFTEIPVPSSDPLSPADEVVKIDAAVAQAIEDLDKAEVELLELKVKHRSFLKGTDEELAIQVEKGSVPLRLAVSKYSYIMDAWVPTSKVEEVKKHLEEKLGDDVHVEVMEERSRSMEDSEAQEPRFQKVPTKTTNGKVVSEFEYTTNLVSRPKYQEIDPTVFIMIFLPIFFGIMVGDVGYAIPFIILGGYGLNKTKNKDWRSIALVLFLGGIWAALFGAFFYGEMLGMHFVGGHYEAGHWIWYHDNVAMGGTAVTWDWLLGEHFPEWFCNMIGHVNPDGTHTGVGKLEDVAFLLKLSVYIGLCHLFVGHMCGLYNKKIQHGFKHAFIEKGGVVLSFFGIIFLCYGLTDFMFNKASITEGLAFYTLVIGIVLLVIGTVINAKAEGALQAILGLPEHIGQILSYTRLAAIGMSKAGMALAFNYIVFSMVMSTSENAAGVVEFDPMAAPVMLILGIVMFCFLHLVIWTLAILSAGIHSLRLQFVELMMRFFDGGGEEFKPLKEARSKTFFKNKISNINEV